MQSTQIGIINVTIESRVLKHHEKTDTPAGLDCARVCSYTSRLRNEAIKVIDKFYSNNGTYKLSDESAAEIGLPPLGLNDKGKPKHYRGKIWDANILRTLLAKTDVFKEFHTKVAMQCLRHVQQEWSSWDAALWDYRKKLKAIKEGKLSPKKLGYRAEPQAPGYKGDKGQYRAYFTYEAVSFNKNKGYLTIARTGIKIKNTDLPVEITKDNLKGIEIQPTRYGYNLNVIYGKAVEPPDLSASHVHVAGMDIGQVEFAVLASSDPSTRTAMIGAGLAVYLNRKVGHASDIMKSQLPKGVHDSKRLAILYQKHDNRMNTFLHTVAKRIVEHCLANGIGKLACANNPGWKHKINLGKRTNRTFCSLPFARFREILAYKCHEAGILYIDQEESYTSKTSFVDCESVEKHETYVGKRVKRSTFRTKEGRIVHADQNGALNILRKCFGESVIADKRESYLGNPRNISLHHPIRIPGRDGHQPEALGEAIPSGDGITPVYNAKVSIRC